MTDYFLAECRDFQVDFVAFVSSVYANQLAAGSILIFTGQESICIFPKM